MTFVDFVSVEPFTPISSRFEQTDRYVRCLSAEKKNMNVCFHHFPHFPNLIMLIIMLLHLHSALADHCRRQPHMLLWCRYRAASAMGLQAANSPFVSCAPRVCSCDMLIVQGQFQLRCWYGQAASADNQVCLFKKAVLCCFKVNRQKSHKIHRIKNLHITIRTEYFARCIFISEKIFFGYSSLWRLFYHRFSCCYFSYLVVLFTKSVPIGLTTVFKPFWNTKNSCAMPVDKCRRCAL